MTSPDDGTSGPVPAAGDWPRHCPPRRDKRGASAERGSWEAAGGDSSPALSSSRASLSSNRDSGYVPSPYGAVRFELECGDAEDSLPSASPPAEDSLLPSASPPAEDSLPAVPAPRRPGTQPIAIPGRPAAGLTPPEESALLRRRLRRHRSPPPSSDEEDEGQEDGPEDEDDEEEDPEGEEEGPGELDAPEEQGRDEVDQAEAADQVALLYREARSLHVGWREGAVLPPGFTFRADLPDVVPPRHPAAGEGGAAAAALVSVSAPAGRRRHRPVSRPSSVSLTVELDVGQELREIADSLPLSRSAPGALQRPRRDFWTLIQRTFDFGIRPEMAPRARRNAVRQ